MSRPARDHFWLSRVLHALDEASASPTVAALSSLAALAILIFFIAAASEHTLVIYAAIVEVLTLVLVFVVQHTQGREQAATQRKLDEIIRAISDADSGVIRLEEASDEEMERVAERQERSARTPG